MNDKPLIPWFIAKCDGKILAAHCDCMAGLGETCSHVASLLWKKFTNGYTKKCILGDAPCN